MDTRQYSNRDSDEVALLKRLIKTDPKNRISMNPPCETCKANGKQNCGNTWCYTNIKDEK